MGESKTLILIDGQAFAFRQYYALERTNMQTKEGIPTWAVYGFFKAIFDLLKNKDLAPDAIGVAFDVSHHTFRTEKFQDYKANRVEMPDAMQVQMGLIYEGLKAFSIPIYTKEGFEADDVIGTISERACELGHKVLILTGDQDSFQLIKKNGCVKVILPYKGELLEYDWDRVYEKLGVYPDQVVDYKALRGDVSDNIPGVKGIGEKTAVKLLAEFKTVDNVLANADKIQANAVRERIKSGVEQAQLSKYLATIVKDVDIEFDFDKANIELPNILNVTEFLRKMQFYSYLKNIENILKLFNKDAEIPTVQSLPQEASGGQLGLFAQAVQTQVNKKSEDLVTAKLITDTNDFEDLIKKLHSSKLFSFRFFADVKNPLEFDLYGIAFAFDEAFGYDGSLNIKNPDRDTQVFYIPLKHNLENQLKVSYIFNGLKSVFENSNIKKLTHDVKSCTNILFNFGIRLDGFVFDTMLASYIKNSSASNNFDIQCMERINHILPTMVSDDKDKKFTDYDIDFVKKYTSEVMFCLFELVKYWFENLDKKEYSILCDIEIPLAFVLANMEEQGVSVDVEYLHSLTKEFDKKIAKDEDRIYAIAGLPFNINSPKQVGEILFGRLGINSGKRGKAKNSTSAEVLNSLAQDYEIAGLILDYRKYAKLKSTYTEA